MSAKDELFSALDADTTSAKEELLSSLNVKDTLRRGPSPRTLDSASAVAASTSKAGPPTFATPYGLLLDPLAAQADDPQRIATALERALTWITTPGRVYPGAVNAALKGENVIEGVAKGITNQPGYGSFIDAGMKIAEKMPDLPASPVVMPGQVQQVDPNGAAKALAFGGGLAADVLNPGDPINWIGAGGLTKTGKVAEQAAKNLEVAKFFKYDPATVAEMQGRVAQAGEFGATMSEQAAKGQRALLTYGGQTLVGGKRVFGAVERLAELSKDKPGLGIFHSAASLIDLASGVKGARKTAVLAGMGKVQAAQDVAAREASKTLTPIIKEDVRIMRDLDLSVDDWNEIKSVVLERSKVPDDFSVWEHLNPDEQRKYGRLLNQANARKFGLGEVQPEAPIQRMGAPAGALPRSEAMKGKGRSRTTVRRMGEVSDPAFESGSVPPRRLAERHPERPPMSNIDPLQFSTSFRGAGKMPDEFKAMLPKNSVAAVERLERASFERAQVRQLQKSIEAAMLLHGQPATKHAEPFLKKLVGMHTTMMAAELSAKMANGIPISALDASVEYMARRLTPEAKALMDEFGVNELKGVARQFTERHAAQIQRKLPGDLTTVEANKLWANGDMGLADGIPRDRLKNTKLFHDDPIAAMGMSHIESAKAIAGAQFIRNAATMDGWAREASLLKPDELKKLRADGWREVPNDIVGIGDRYLFSPEIADVLTKHVTTFKSPGAFHKLSRAWDEYNRIWKKYFYGIFPQDWTRNEIGDIHNAAIMGEMNPARLGDSARLLSGKEIGQIRVGSKWMDRFDIMQSARNNGAIDSGITGELLNPADRFRAQPKGITDKIDRFLDDNPLINTTQGINQVRENWTRLALYIDRLEKGDLPEVAAEYVKKYLIDYRRVPEMLAAGKKVAPFLAWTWYNAPLQMEMFLKKPGRFAALQKVREGFARDEEGGKSLGAGMPGVPLPRFLERGLPLRLPDTPQGMQQYARLEGLLPSADANIGLEAASAMASALTGNLGGLIGGASTLSERMLQQLGPIQGPIETTSNIDLYRSRVNRPSTFDPQGAMPGTETQNYLGFSVPRRVIPMVEASPFGRIFSTLDRINPGGMFGDVGAPPSWNPDAGGRNYPNLDPAAQIASLALARAYPVDIAKAMEQQDRAVDEALRALEYSRDKAIERGDMKAANNYQKQMDAIQARPGSVPR